jgi:hypothetical protein
MLAVPCGEVRDPTTLPERLAAGIFFGEERHPASARFVIENWLWGNLVAFVR